MASRVVIDPITRIEGHLRVEAQVKDGKVEDAWSSGTMVRGMEIILKGRDPRDAWAYTERACGVCTTVHALASVRTVENALGIAVPPNAELVRNLMFCAHYLQDHVVHFYHLHALDWVDVVSALKADPKEAARIAQSLSSWPKNSEGYFRDVQNRLKGFAASGQLGIFANAYWGHPAYKLPAGGQPPGRRPLPRRPRMDEGDRQGHDDLRRQEPPPQLPGRRGAPAPSTSRTPTPSTRSGWPSSRSSSTTPRPSSSRSTSRTSWPWPGSTRTGSAIGGGLSNYLAYGDLPTNGYGDPASFKFPRGAIIDRNLAEVQEVKGEDPDQVRETIAHSWYRYGGGDVVALHPWDGETELAYTGPKPPYEELDVAGKYSWLKTPRWKGRPMEVGPLARLLVAYASGSEEVREVVNGALAQLGAPVTALFSTLGRTAARGLETRLIARWALGFYDDLIANIKKGDTRMFNAEKWDPKTWPKEARGVGMSEAPAGRPGPLDRHQGREDRQLPARRARPRGTALRATAAGQRSSYEAALVGTPGRRPGTAGRDPAHHPFVRSVHRLRRPSPRSRGQAPPPADVLLGGDHGQGKDPRIQPGLCLGAPHPAPPLAEFRLRLRPRRRPGSSSPTRRPS